MATEEMRGIPFDSRKQLAEDGSTYEDREVFSADIAEYFGYLSSNGICIHEGDELSNQLKITAGTAGTVIFNPGTIKIQGRMGWMENAVEKQAEAGGTKPRYDTAVIELNLSTAERRFIPKIIKGEESDAPTPPELTQTANIYQLGLANIYRTANSTALGTITDTRKDTTRCGISKVAVPNLPGVVPADLDPNTFFPSGADLDDYTYPGTYVSEGASVSATLLNCPFTTGGFVLFTQKTAYNNYRQILLGNADECPKYERRRGNGSWSPWVQAGTVTIKKVWVNASPNSKFVSQEIPSDVDTTDDDWVVMIVRLKAGSDAESIAENAVIFRAGANGTLSMSGTISNRRGTVIRTATFGANNPKRYTIGGGLYFNDQANTNDNDVCIPVAMYIVKGVI